MRTRIFGGNKFYGLLILAMMFSSGMALAQKQVKKDTTIILINNVGMQVEISEALNDLYNFKFEKAERQFRWFKQKYPWHPLPYFLHYARHEGDKI